MPKIVLVKPADGLRVLDPVDRKPLPPAGKKVVLSTYWLRRQDAEEVDLEEVDTAKTAPGPTEQSEAPAKKKGK